MSSIFEEKIEFDGQKYRTPKFKEGFGFIYQKINELQAFKKEKGDKLSNVSHLVQAERLELSHLAALDPKSSVSTNSTTPATKTEILFQLSDCKYKHSSEFAKRNRRNFSIFEST